MSPRDVVGDHPGGSPRTSGYFSPRETVDTSPVVADEVKYTTCYMCACRCGIRVHLKDGRIRYIDGNPRHPVNRGVLCGKGSAGIMQQYSPAKLTKPLLRVGERGAGEFREIEWDEALSIATGWLDAIRRSDPKRLAFFTGRDQSQSLTGWWAAQFGTPNFAAHGGFCSVNMAAGGLYSIGGSFWEFGEPDWDHARYFLMFGVAEDHDSNPIKLGMAKLRARGAKIVSVNPARTGYSAIADEWIGITPGTDGLFVLSLAHELLRRDLIDLDFLVQHTDAAYLVRDAPGTATDGLFVRDESGAPLAWDRNAKAPAPAARAGIAPAVVGRFTLPDGGAAVPVFARIAERLLSPEYAPDAVAARCGIAADTIRRIAGEIAAASRDHVVIEQPWTDTAGRRHERMIGRPVAMHAMRGISAHSNGFHTCRDIHVLQMLLGAVDTPGSWRYKSPYPRPMPVGPAPAGKGTKPMTPIAGNILGFPHGPDDLMVNEAGNPLRLDKSFSWEAPLGLHGMMHTVLGNALAGDPYPIDTLFMYMANMAWNSSMNPGEATAALTARGEDGEYRIPHVIYADAYFSETVAYADLVLPDTTYFERWDCISILDRPIGSAHGPADAIRQPVLKPDRDVRPFQDVLLDLGARLGLPGLTSEDGSPRYRDYPDYIVNHERKPGNGPLAGWRGATGTEAGLGAPNPHQLDEYLNNQCFWRYELPPEQLYFKHSNKDYLETAHRMGLVAATGQIVLSLWSEPLQKFRLAAEGHGKTQPPDRLRARIRRFCDPLPSWYPPFEDDDAANAAFPLHAITQRPMQMYHSWHSQNAWLRQIIASNRLYMHRETAARLGVGEDGWVWVSSRAGRLKCQVRLVDGVNADTVWTWNAIGKRRGAWNLSEDAPEAKRGFLLNHVLSVELPRDGDRRVANADPVTGQAAWFDARVRIEPAEPEADAVVPRPEALPPEPFLPRPPTILRFDAGTAG